MWFGIISIFPEMFNAVTRYGIIGKAINNGLISIKSWNIRDFAKNNHRTVDDRPYGGGSGMLLLAQPLISSIYEARRVAGSANKVIYLSPQGKRLNQDIIRSLISNTKLILVCGRYKGIDERVYSVIDEEWSIGDYVLSGGELPAMVIIDSITRLIPGVLKKQDSFESDSFFKGLLDFPHYSRPRTLNGMNVPKILLSGNHKNIKEWRLKQALGRTWLKRPDLLKKKKLSKDHRNLLDQFKREYRKLCMK